MNHQIFYKNEVTIKVLKKIGNKAAKLIISFSITQKLAIIFSKRSINSQSWVMTFFAYWETEFFKLCESIFFFFYFFISFLC